MLFACEETAIHTKCSDLVEYDLSFKRWAIPEELREYSMVLIAEIDGKREYYAIRKDREVMPTCIAFKACDGIYATISTDFKGFSDYVTVTVDIQDPEQRWKTPRHLSPQSKQSNVDKYIRVGDQKFYMVDPRYSLR